ncbi:9873_t:CDS:1, partial [Gigaspora rosea]
VEYIIVNPEKAFIEKEEAKDDDAEQREIGRSQVIKYMIVKLNEQYKAYKNNMKSRQNVFAAQIFLSLIAIFLGQLFALAETYNIIAKVGTQLSSLLGGIGTLVALFTAYINRTKEKYDESSSETVIDKNNFKPMYLNIDDIVIKQFVKNLQEGSFYHECEKKKGGDTNE